MLDMIQIRWTINCENVSSSGMMKIKLAVVLIAVAAVTAVAYYTFGPTQAERAFKAGEAEMLNFKTVDVEQFIEPAICSGCHQDIFAQWNGSMHSKAFTDPVWRAATKLFMQGANTPGEVLEMKACVKCHTPLGFRAGLLDSPDDDYDALPPLPSEGIFCNWCHNISEVKRLGDAQYTVQPGKGLQGPSTMLGPRDDARSSFHPTQYSALHTKAEFCGLCHNVSHAANGLPIETTYDEWKNGPYNTGDPATTVRCQDCHMRQRPGVAATGKTERPDNPGKACVVGPDREHVATHYFVGGNAVITTLMGSALHAEMAVARLQNAADLELLLSETYSRGQPADIRVKVTNSGAGHYLPTGLTEVREMWIEVKVTDAAGQRVFHSGHLDAEGNIAEGSAIYHTVLGNAAGDAVLNVAQATQVLRDYRIPPKGHVIETYAFAIPDQAQSPLTVESALYYRSIAPSLARTLLGDAAPAIPIITMVQTSAEIEL